MGKILKYSKYWGGNYGFYTVFGHLSEIYHMQQASMGIKQGRWVLDLTQFLRVLDEGGNYCRRI